MKNPSNYTLIRNYKDGDEKEIIRLFREVFNKNMTIEQWRWKYRKQGMEKIYSKVAENTGGKIIGHVGAIPLKGTFHNRPIQFFQTVDVMVHPSFRGLMGNKNLFVKLTKSLFEEIGKGFSDVVCYGFPGERPFILGKRTGVYEKIEHGVESAKVLSRSFLNPLSIKKINWSSEKLNILWRNLSKHFPLSLVRDRAYLNWRYSTNPFFSYELIGFFFLGKFKGWAVIKDSTTGISVVDLLAKPKQLNVILKSLENYLFSKGHKHINLWLPERWRNHLKGYKHNRTDIVVTNMVWNLPIKTPVVREGLYYTMGDIDIF